MAAYIHDPRACLSIRLRFATAHSKTSIFAEQKCHGFTPPFITDWSHYGTRPYAAIIDMTEVPRHAYYQVNRGFGNEFNISDPSTVKVIEVLPRQKAFAKDRQQRQYLEDAIKNAEDLEAFYRFATDEERP